VPLIQTIPALAEAFTMHPNTDNTDDDVKTFTLSIKIRNTGDRPVRAAFADIVETRSDGTIVVHNERKTYSAFDDESGIRPGQTTMATGRLLSFAALRSQNAKIIYVRITKVSERYISPQDTPPPTSSAQDTAVVPVTGG
jgi:hypothetical protein